MCSYSLCICASPCPDVCGVLPWLLVFSCYSWVVSYWTFILMGIRRYCEPDGSICALGRQWYFKPTDKFHHRVFQIHPLNYCSHWRECPLFISGSWQCYCTALETFANLICERKKNCQCCVSELGPSFFNVFIMPVAFQRVYVWTYI